MVGTVVLLLLLVLMILGALWWKGWLWDRISREEGDVYQLHQVLFEKNNHSITALIQILFYENLQLKVKQRGVAVKYRIDESFRDFSFFMCYESMQGLKMTNHSYEQ